MFTDLFFDLILSYGAFPGIVIYLVYVIVRDYRKDLKDMQTKLDDGMDLIQQSINEQNEAINELIEATTRLQSTMSSQVQLLLMKYVEMSVKQDGGDE